ncbi:hypothetical protein [Caulobacter endophyticus]|uniref:Uncharacterized protein n=1 Tax=Caulobacter endophyticus TaxID=2172652 RepID=A0A2T9JEI3_9CAUL|nr:hypothetical protein [Caulobacter endophyticus]PVM82076.1 hypothetical protein DDF67_23995 [Caulobacter endophyticus]
MTQAEIDSLLQAMQDQFDKTGDDADRPGVITFQTDEWIGKNLPTCCTAIWRGIRYRGIRILAARIGRLGSGRGEKRRRRARMASPTRTSRPSPTRPSSA